MCVYRRIGTQTICWPIELFDAIFVFRSASEMLQVQFYRKLLSRKFQKNLLKSQQLGTCEFRTQDCVIVTS